MSSALRSPSAVLLSAFFVLIVAVLVAQAVWSSKNLSEYVMSENEPCEGQAIIVDYPFRGGMIEPHACAVQCKDSVQRYVLYTNDKATQCQKLPGCLDTGEDRGVTCVPPVNS